MINSEKIEIVYRYRGQIYPTRQKAEAGRRDFFEKIEKLRRYYMDSKSYEDEVKRGVTLTTYATWWIIDAHNNAIGTATGEFQDVIDYALTQTGFSKAHDGIDEASSLIFGRIEMTESPVIVTKKKRSPNVGRPTKKQPLDTDTRSDIVSAYRPYD